MTKATELLLQEDRKYVSDACSYFTRSSDIPSMLERRSVGWIIDEVCKNLGTENFAIDKKMLVYAIIGKGFCGSHRFAMEMTDRGLAVFTGNQHNENWSWNIDGLDALSIEELKLLYNYDA